MCAGLTKRTVSEQLDTVQTQLTDATTGGRTTGLLGIQPTCLSDSLRRLRATRGEWSGTSPRRPHAGRVLWRLTGLCQQHARVLSRPAGSRLTRALAFCSQWRAPCDAVRKTGGWVLCHQTLVLTARRQTPPRARAPRPTLVSRSAVGGGLPRKSHRWRSERRRGREGGRERKRARSLAGCGVCALGSAPATGESGGRREGGGASERGAEPGSSQTIQRDSSASSDSPDSARPGSSKQPVNVSGRLSPCCYRVAAFSSPLKSLQCQYQSPALHAPHCESQW